LIHQWKRLRDWIREHREFLLWRERLKSQVTQWLRSGRDPDLLYHGAELDVAIEWDEKRHPELNQLEIEFIDASRRARDAAEADAHHRSVRMKRLMGIAIVVLLIVAVVAIYFVGKYANQLADGHLRVLVYAAQGVASTVLWDLERLSGPVLEAANDPKLRDLLKDNKVKCPPNPKECRLIDAMIKNNDVQPWLKSHREEIDRLEKLRNNNKENVVKQNGVQCWLQDHAEKISLKQGKYLAFENYYVLDGEGKLLADSWHGGKKQPTEQPTVWEPNAKAIGKEFPFRDYFLGAMSHRGREERASVHISRVYQAVSDGCYKFSISAPVHDKNPGSPPLGVVVVTIATLPELGHLLKDKWVTNVLVGREDINPFSDSGPASQPDRYHGYDLRLMPPVNDVNGIPTGGKNLIIVAAVNRVLHFRIFDGDGKVVVDTDEKRLTEQARLIKSLGKQLESLWPPHVLTTSEKGRLIDDVKSIVVQTRYLIMVHPAYSQCKKPSEVYNPCLQNVHKPQQGKPEIELPDLQAFPPEKAMDNNYLDPLGGQSGEFKGRMLAGFAPVGNTQFAVIVQQRYDQAIPWIGRIASWPKWSW